MASTKANVAINILAKLTSKWIPYVGHKIMATLERKGVIILSHTRGHLRFQYLYQPPKLRVGIPKILKKSIYCIAYTIPIS
jgi:hypothetical protein